MEWTDIGCNLGHESFTDDWPAVLDDARAAGVTRLVVTGASVAGSDRALELAQARPDMLRATAGVHPHLASDFDDGAARHLAGLHDQALVAAVGECGLDYFRDFSPRTDQRRAFEAQLELAARSAKPVFLHQRDAHDDFVAILKSFRDRLGPVVVHCFTDTAEALHDYLDLDCHIGITGWICDERRGLALKGIVREIPAGRLMLETDAPYLKPRNLRPKARTHRNEPQWLPWIGGTVAALRGVTPAELAAQTTANARAFFRWNGEGDGTA
ncbi:MAG: TatD family hydrolase [Wenzhouxiangellaceae bacterium]|nr:TatD family hydrolase [Wenzhouxiangellaceae bacterium]